MNYLLDTNILLGYLRGEPSIKALLEKKELFDGRHVIAISAVSIGELMSLAKQRQWSDTRYKELIALTGNFLVIPVESQDLFEKYAEIDAYSQGKLAGQALPAGISSRNMGKNDLWIAATAALIDATLLTTDKDFSHLQGVFLEVEVIDPKMF